MNKARFMTSDVSQIPEYTGLLSGFRARLEHNRLGDLLVASRLISPVELREALALQKVTDQPLGKVLLQQKIISAGVLRGILMQQVSLRVLAALLTVFLSFASMGGIKTARAGVIRDVPAEISLVAPASATIAPLTFYPTLMGMTERRSVNLRPFTKWSGMFDSFEEALNTAEGRKILSSWQADLRPLRHLSLDAMAGRVNDLVNREKYVSDIKNWGVSDHWSDPLTFFARGGDCEDFAIAKYASLRMLGVPEERLRLLIVHDTEKDIPHAVLVVYTDHGALILDNQTKRVMIPAKATPRYRPIFSINRTAWWLHTTPQSGTGTLVATASGP